LATDYTDPTEGIVYDVCKTMLPSVIGHADWSADPKKRWICTATLEADAYRVESPAPVDDVRTLLRRVMHRAHGRSAVLGFDFPIGIPERYAARAGIQSFRTALLEFGAGRWRSFYDPARTPTEIALERPFYPGSSRKGSQKTHLLNALGLDSVDDLLRQCDRPHEARGAACSLFWTLGPNQVGRAAIVGWRDMLAPALRAGDVDVALWPFDGELRSLIGQHACVIAETYPAECSVQLGLAAGLRWSKRKQGDRRTKATRLLSWSSDRLITWTDALASAIYDGFGSSGDGEDRFDALIGVLGMVDVVAARRAEGAPKNAICRDVEGWILGQNDPSV